MEKFAKDIKDCDECPLYGNDCNPPFEREAPCCSWNPDDIITPNMYEYAYEVYEAQKDIRKINAAKRTRKETKKLDKNVDILKDFLKSTKWGEILSLGKRDRYYIYLGVKYTYRPNMKVRLKDFSLQLSNYRAVNKNTEVELKIYRFLHPEDTMNYGFVKNMSYNEIEKDLKIYLDNYNQRCE